ncbi:amino acid ABC transporter substrate-binding protein [Viridibacterium curvum]|uniref:Amino acid ABC transporter substrate-binding protein n=1 Tax=Viridibacterium curvum TaxID=1101404 RepID=A0ABP9QS96_9RHOO
MPIVFPRAFQYCVVVLALSIHASTGQAQSASVIDKLKAGKPLEVGIREATKPFSWFPEGSKVPTGYSVEICNGAIEHVKKDLKLRELTVNYVPVNSTSRMAKIKSREIDMECGITVNTESRQKDADFSYALFISGQQVLSRRSAGITDLSSLNGKIIAITKGTTAEKLFPQLRDSMLQQMRLVTFASNQEAFKALESGQVQGFAQIDVVLETMRIQSAQANELVMTKESLSVEPNSIMLPKDDPEFRKLVNAGLRKLYASPAMGAIYKRWFQADGFNIPMSRMLRESFNSPAGNAGVALILGYSL